MIKHLESYLAVYNKNKDIQCNCNKCKDAYLLGFAAAYKEVISLFSNIYKLGGDKHD